MRLFVAVVPPPEVVEHLAEFLAPRQEAGSGLRWTDPHQWHVTLAFLETVLDRQLDDLSDRLAQVAARHQPFPLAVRGGTAFPSPYEARVLVADLVDPGGALPPLAAGARGACNAAGATPDGRRFHPHLTLARFHRPTEATRWVRVLDTYVGPQFTARELALVQSHLGEGRGRRPRYETRDSFPLGGPPAPG